MDRRFQPSGPAPSGSEWAFVARLRAALAVAWVVLAWEALWPALAPAALIGGAFLAVALFDLLPGLPGWLHAAILALFALAALVALAVGLRRFTLPGWTAARRRIEQASGLSHRPLQTIGDRPAGGDPATIALWHAHRARARAAIGRLRTGWPKVGMPARDPYALRALVLLVLVVAAAWAGGDWRGRVADALHPDLAGTPPPAPTLDAWIAPPDYTGLPPVYLKAGMTVPVPVPMGSKLTARIANAPGRPVLSANDADSRFQPAEAHTFTAVATIRKGGRIAVSAGGALLGTWPIRVVPDQPPTASFTAPPSASVRGALRLDYAASDDYGVTRLTATIRLATTEPTPYPPIVIPLAVGDQPRQVRGTSFDDLTPHPWAGLPVTIRLAATDGAGQQGKSPVVHTVLPERVFHQPVARAIIAARKRLVMAPNSARLPVARALSMLSVLPQAYGNRIGTFLALRAAVARLAMDPSAEGTHEVVDLLWDTALALEDGGVSLAERDLRAAEQALQDALDRKAPDAEIQAAMDRLQQALNRFLQAMGRQMQQQPQATAQMPLNGARTVRPQDLQAMLDQVRALSRAGDRNAARQMLSQLQQMLENLRPAGPADSRAAQQARQAQSLMRDLEALTRNQRNLLDQTFRQAGQGSEPQGGQPENSQPQAGQPGQQGQTGPGQSDANQLGAAQQEALRHQLGEIMRRLGDLAGEIPRPLGRAEQAMRDSTQALRDGSMGSATRAQGQALDQLQQGLQAFARQMMQQMQANGIGQGNPQDQPGRDPLGRALPGNGVNDDGSVQIPGKPDMQRAREILDELRRRAADPARPAIERDYIDRLLRQF